MIVTTFVMIVENIAIGMMVIAHAMRMIVTVTANTTKQPIYVFIKSNQILVCPKK